MLSITLLGCEDYLDVNKDPNVLGDIPKPEVLLPTAELNLANTLMGWDFGFGGGFWSEYWTQTYTASQFKTLCEYKDANFGSAYANLTSGVLMDLKRISTLSKEKGNEGLSYVSEALSIYTWQVMVDLWGDLPYREALKGNEGVASPKFDTGKEIYTDLLKRIDKLVQQDVSKMYVSEKFDFMFAGNMNKWKQFVNSLKLKLNIRLSETGQYNNATLLNFVKNNEFLTSSAKISGAIFADEEGKRHPMVEFQANGANYLSQNVIGTKNFVDYLKLNSDPRLEKLFEKAKSGTYVGAFFGDFANKKDTDGNGKTDDKESYSQPKFEANTDLMIMSLWEVDFFISEVYARAGDNANAKKYYDEAIKASLTQHKISDFSILDGYAKWKDGSMEDEIKQIAQQKWVANANYQHIESFIDRNRTRYPVLNPIKIEDDRKKAFENFPAGELTVSIEGRAKTNGKLPQSLVYPSSIITRNVNAPSQKPDMLQKVWWNQKNQL